MASNSSTSGEAAGMFAAGMVVMVEVAVLLAGLGSLLDVVTVAVLDSGPAVDGVVMVRLIVAEPALAIVPRLQVTVVVPLQVPWLGVADVKVVPAGRMSVTTTFAAAPGPALE